MNNHSKKIIAPIVVTTIMVLLLIGYFSLIITIFDGLWVLILGIIPIILSIVMIKVCIERLNEIKKGEEDDLSKYWLHKWKKVWNVMSS